MQYEDEAPKMARRAFAALNAGDLEEAQRLALHLREMSYSAHFELQALIHLDKGELQQAINVLRQGIEQTPDVWSLWQLLGNCLSDNGQFDEALRCYERALELDLDREDRASILFNQATVLSRVKREAEALEILDPLSQETISDYPLLQINIELLRLDIWATSGRCDDVALQAAQVESLLYAVERADGEDFRALSAVWSRGALILIQCGFVQRAIVWAKQALDVFGSNSQALEVLRLSDPNAPLAKRTFEVLLEGVKDNNGFFVSYAVVAHDPDEAQSLALSMERPRHASALTVSECKPLGKCEKTPVGVYEVGSYSYFPNEAQNK